VEASELVALLIIGALAGSAAASLMGLRKSKKGNWIYNTVIGILGAIVGTLLFDALKWNPPEILTHPITAAEVLIAFIGGVIVIIVVSIIGERT
jgi:uncharacterized membrane protein YeaQ/YmgE (transglycosylase-associated protein family)